MDVLIALGTSAAYFTSTASIIGYSYLTGCQASIVMSMVNPEFEAPLYYETSVFLIAFVIVGRFLENYAKSQTSKARLLRPLLTNRRYLSFSDYKQPKQPLLSMMTNIILLGKN